MKKSAYLEELKGLSQDELEARELALKEEIMKYRFRATSAQLEKSHLVTEAKKNLARVKTQMALNKKK